jgi:hypothetical protein
MSDSINETYFFMGHKKGDIFEETEHRILYKFNETHMTYWPGKH